MSLHGFFDKHPVFTVEELSHFLKARGSHSGWTRKSLVAHHQKQGRIFRIRRGLYAAVPPGDDPQRVDADPYLVASRLADDAVLGYHTALELHGKAHSVFGTFYYLTRRQRRPFRFRSAYFVPALVPHALRKKRREDFGVKTLDRAGLPVRVTTLERTLVDLLDRLDLGGGPEEVWRSLEAVEFFDLDQVVTYAALLENATTVAKVGVFLEQHRKALWVDEAHLERLRRHVPKQPHYFTPDRKTGRLVRQWNLIVPEEILDRSWQEVP